MAADPAGSVPRSCCDARDGSDTPSPRADPLELEGDRKPTITLTYYRTEEVTFSETGDTYVTSRTGTTTTHVTGIDPTDQTNHTTVDLADEQILTRVIAADGTV